MVFAGYVVAPEPLWAMLFYLLVLPTELYQIATSSPAGIRKHLSDAAAISGYALIGWFILCVAWDQGATGHPAVRVLWLFNAVCTLAFVSACNRHLPDADERDKMISLITIGTLLGVTIALARAPFLSLDWAQWQPRLPGWAEMRLPITGAMIAGMGVILALERVTVGRRVGLNGAIIASGMIFILLTGSRMPIGALLFAIMVFFAMTRPYWLACGATAAVILSALVFLATPDIATRGLHAALDRGDSHRLEIWSESLKEIAGSPWIGHGPSARLDLTGFGAFPHNLFLSTLFYAGAIGLVLLLIYVIVVVRLAIIRSWGHDRAGRVALLVFLVASSMTDLSVLIKGPSQMWYAFWLPMIIASRQGHRQSSNDRAAPNQLDS